MTVSVLVVDDSGFFRRRLRTMLDASPELKVVGTAANGKEAVELTSSLNPDVITMDYEMPVMDGITAVREIMRTHPTPILMFSSLTYEGARVTLDALEAAVDYLPKNFEEIARDNSEIKIILRDRLIAISASKCRKSTMADVQPAPVTPAIRPKPAARKSYQIVTIGTSTGGPMALQVVLTGLPGNFPVPILVVQHMPAAFTAAFAQRLDRMCNINVKEASDGERAQRGCAYVAPGGMQMLIDPQQPGTLRIIPGDDRLNYKPSVDITFGSAAKAYAGNVLAIVLTGMGSDGREGVKMLRKQGARIWTQDEPSCVIYGMPMAVASANLSDEVVSLATMGSRIVEEVS